MPKIRILVADDHQVLRAGLVGLLAGEHDFEVVAEASNGRDAVKLARELEPDVAVLDVTMPGLGGIEAARQIRERCPRTQVVGLSMHAETRFVTEMFQAGASGYVLKMAAFDEVAGAIRTVAAGGHYASPGVAGGVIADLASKAPPTMDGGLSEREVEVLQLLAEGKGTKEVALALHVSTKTVDTHRRQIMSKLGMSSVAELTKYAIRRGLTPLDS